ncbi:ABC transporter permease [Acutalibacter caecimuris]|uniref:ABC transporter permease n=1 Tax=Acutalibacter caecimuris TaxID=3093657 RepID=UPI002AC8C8B3|nr:ABC transporter permease [Acutalibacter sp. M00118]
MFIWTEAGYQLFRNKGRSILLVCASLLLCGCIAFYLGNIDSSKRALAALSESTPAQARISNLNADEFDNLTISYTFVDTMSNLGIGKVIATSEATCYMDPALLEEVNTLEAARQEAIANRANDFIYVPNHTPKGDAKIYGITCWEATGLGREDVFTLLEGYDLSAMEGEEAVCLVSDSFAEKYGLALGDTLDTTFSCVQYDSFRMPVYTYIGETNWKVIGVYPASQKTDHRADLYVPMGWMRPAVGEKVPFTYTSYTGYLADSMKLNEFKEQAAEYSGLGQPFFLPTDTHMSPNLSIASTLYMEDEDFIRTAEKLGQGIRQYEAFLIPFFTIVVFLVTLAIFLVLRGCRRDMAVACSLGRSKRLTGTATLLAALGAQLAGALLSVPLTLLLTGISLGAALLVCGAFMLCALLGDVVGLLALLRFDALALLTASD